MGAGRCFLTQPCLVGHRERSPLMTSLDPWPHERSSLLRDFLALILSHSHLPSAEVFQISMQDGLSIEGILVKLPISENKQLCLTIISSLIVAVKDRSSQRKNTAKSYKPPN